MVVLSSSNGSHRSVNLLMLWPIHSSKLPKKTWIWLIVEGTLDLFLYWIFTGQNSVSICPTIIQYSRAFYFVLGNYRHSRIYWKSNIHGTEHNDATQSINRLIIHHCQVRRYHLGTAQTTLTKSWTCEDFAYCIKPRITPNIRYSSFSCHGSSGKWTCLLRLLLTIISQPCGEVLLQWNHCTINAYKYTQSHLGRWFLSKRPTYLTMFSASLVRLRALVSPLF